MKIHLDVFNTVYKGEDTLEDAIQAMKDASATQMESVATLVSALKLSIYDADILILNSKAWQDQKNLTLEFRNKIDEILIKLKKRDKQ